MPCLTDEAAVRLLDGSSEPPPGFDQHVESCVACRELWVALAEAGSLDGEAIATRRDSPPQPEPKAEPNLSEPMLGGFVPLGVVGRGGMGEVIRAYDSTLHREVALKRIHPHLLAAESRARFEREARAMARINHPNVVTLYALERLDDGDFVLVMEYVDGPSLKAWLEAKSRDPDEIIERFLQAGRGLAEAHRRGLLHRDFKPANVLISESGAKVTDFGLAKGSLDNDGGGQTEPLDPSRGGGTDDLTQVDEVLGTPAYMAPEQHRGRVLTPASDQFAFCVALWEALVGHRPFAGPSHSLMRQKLAGPPAWPRSAGPRWLGQALLRGLDPDPTQRWRSVESLLRRIQPERRRRASLGWIAAGTLAGAGVAATVLTADSSSPCSTADRAMSNAWSPEHKYEVTAALRDADQVEASAAVRALDDYSVRWQAAATTICELAREEASLADRSARARSCIDGAFAEFTTLVDGLETANGTLARKVLDLVDGLLDPRTCTDPAALDALPPRIRDPELRARADGLRATIANSAVAHARGDSDGCLTRLAGIEPELEELGRPSLAARHRYVRGSCLLGSGQPEQALLAWEQSFNLAVESGDDLRAIDAALQSGVAQTDGDWSRGRAWVERARALLRRHDYQLPSPTIGVAIASANVHMYQGDFDSALEELDAAEVRARELDASDHLRLRLRTLRAMLLVNSGRVMESEALVRTLYDDVLASYHPTHPRAIAAGMVLGASLSKLGYAWEAIGVFRVALDAARTHDPTLQSGNAQLLFLLAGSLATAGELNEAREILLEALPLFERMGDGHGLMAMQIRTWLAILASTAGDFSTADAYFSEASGERDTTNATPLEHAIIHVGLGALARKRGDYAKAEQFGRDVYAMTDRQTDSGIAADWLDIRLQALLLLESIGASLDAGVWRAFEADPETPGLLRVYVPLLRAQLGRGEDVAVGLMASRVAVLARRVAAADIAADAESLASAARHSD